MVETSLSQNYALIIEFASCELLRLNLLIWRRKQKLSLRSWQRYQNWKSDALSLVPYSVLKPWHDVCITISSTLRHYGFVFRFMACGFHIGLPCALYVLRLGGIIELKELTVAFNFNIFMLFRS
jgi:hypothetical protein